MKQIFKIWDEVAQVMYEPFELSEMMMSKEAPDMAEHYIYIQSTGKIDLNGNLIFNGDILDAGKKVKYVVFWNDEKARFAVKFPNIYSANHGKFLFKSLEFATQNAWVVGNIYQHKELLKN